MIKTNEKDNRYFASGMFLDVIVYAAAVNCSTQCG